MAIYLVRHATPEVEKGICYGQSDLNLKEGYESQFEKMIAALPSSNAKVISSPLLRCKLFAHRLSDKIVIDERLMEISFGEWELSSWDDIPKNEIDPWFKDYLNVAPPDGESYQELRERVIDFCEERLHDRNDDLIVVCHAGVIRTILSWYSDIPEKESLALELGYGEIIELTESGKYSSMMRCDSTPDLQASLGQ